MAKKSGEKPPQTFQVVDRFDPSEDAEIDGDPAFETKLKDESIPTDVIPLWAHQSDVRFYKGRGYRDLRSGEDGVEMLCGAQFAEGEQMTFRDHVLLGVDRATYERRYSNERSLNRKARMAILKNSTGTMTVGDVDQKRMSVRG